MLFAAVGLLLGGIDDLLIDLLYIVRTLWRRLTVYTRHRPMTTATLPDDTAPGGMAVFIPAWQEAAVIGPMLRAALGRWGDGDYRIFVGVYPNDPATATIVRNIADSNPHVIPVVTGRPGPTTKADCLNAIWTAMLAEEALAHIRFKAVVLHDAEDVVHADALRLLSCMVDRFDLVQLPVLPLASQQSKWVAGHYLDEFAESHGKSITVREALGAAVPSAGVGCAFSRQALAALAEEQDGAPFDPHSLTEDYEAGLRIVEAGGRTAFVRMKDARGQLVCTREHFPDTFRDAVKQKARWTVGIALSGWDRLGWRGGVAERWMRLRDRRTALAALVVFVAYLALLCQAALYFAGALTGWIEPALSNALIHLLEINFVLMLWRMAIRAWFVTAAYGWRQGMRSVPRTIIANIILIFAVRRAVVIYFGLMRGAPLRWDKTTHRFPPLAAGRPL